MVSHWLRGYQIVRTNHKWKIKSLRALKRRWNHWRAKSPLLRNDFFETLALNRDHRS